MLTWSVTADEPHWEVTAIAQPAYDVLQTTDIFCWRQHGCLAKGSFTCEMTITVELWLSKKCWNTCHIDRWICISTST